ncbi:zinc finger protein 346-like [Iris pallida]|uniref:Zinc finger protein 346-like n=1 Tax=Iris pallida TaxID=29817 RepID=A0AAX6GRC4_IRIPA|nr:zinc finger protein 346-like [Iris pallida]
MEYSSPWPSPYYSHTNPNPNPAYHHPPPGANPYAPHGGYSFPHRPPVGPAPPPYYHGGAAAGPGRFPPTEPVVQYWFNPPPAAGYGPPMAPPIPSNGLGAVFPPSALATHWITLSNSGGTKKTTKVVQSAYCEVCKVNCTCEGDLNSHKQGKKHRKQLQKLLQESITPKAQNQKAPVAVKSETKELAAASKGKAVVTGEQKKRKKAPQSTEEDLETKKRKMLEYGAVPDDLRVCIICQVVVNSQAVYDSHVAGQKHLANVKQQQEEAAAS